MVTWLLINFDEMKASNWSLLGDAIISGGVFDRAMYVHGKMKSICKLPIENAIPGSCWILSLVIPRRRGGLEIDAVRKTISYAVSSI